MAETNLDIRILESTSSIAYTTYTEIVVLTPVTSKKAP